MRTLLPFAPVLLLAGGLVTASADEAASRPYALNAPVADFEGPGLDGAPVRLSDLEITVEKAKAAVLDRARAHAGEQSVALETPVDALGGVTKAALVGEVGRRFGIAPSADELEDIETLEDVVDWVDEHEVAPIAVVTWSPKCSVCEESYTRKLDRILREDGLRMLFVASHAYEQKESITAALEAMGSQWLVVLDPEQKISDLFGATVTPEVFLLDTDHRLRYRGGVDSEPKAKVGEGEREYLREAADALMNEQPVQILRTEPIGCPFMRKR